MKKVKKLLACLLCLAMLLPTTAFAGQGAAPRADIGGCPNCGQDFCRHDAYYRDVLQETGGGACPYCPSTKNQYLDIYMHQRSDVWDCTFCHYYYKSDYVTEYYFATCPVHGPLIG